MNSHQKTQELHLILLHLSCVLNDKKKMSVASILYRFSDTHAGLFDWKVWGFKKNTNLFKLDKKAGRVSFKSQTRRQSQLEIQHSSHIHFNDQALSGKLT